MAIRHQKSPNAKWQFRLEEALAPEDLSYQRKACPNLTSAKKLSSAIISTSQLARMDSNHSIISGAESSF